jgi:glycerol-3-phosphate dehydrogenase
MSAYDVVVIGGGIHGAGVAQAAAARGHSVLVLEQEHLAAGTSSRSSKLIHGGLRYLEGGHFSVVRECLRERALLLKLAPELVRLRPFNIPVYAGTRRRPWQLRVGLGLYAALAGWGAEARYRTLPKSRWDALDGLSTRDLRAVFQYWDAQTDDAALTAAVMRSAQTLGAELVMPARFLSATLHEYGCELEYAQGEARKSCTARVLINAAGPWANHVLEQVTPVLNARAMDWVQGAHIRVSGELTQGIYYVEAPQDGRAVFVMPWCGDTLVGTTETAYRGDPAQVRPLPEEEAYLAEVLRHYFPERPRERLASFAGLRVLPAGSGTAFGRSRETVLHPDRLQKPRLLTIYGGKLTAYRATADKVLRAVAASLPVRRVVADTRRLPLESCGV